MLIGFLGDLHGHVHEALAVVCRLQRVMGRHFDLVVQLGDFGLVHEDADPQRYPPGSYERLDPGQFDLTRMVQADGKLAEALGAARSELVRPILFIRGDHDDELRLRNWQDPFDLFEYLPDGSMLGVAGVRLAFLGLPEHDHIAPIDVATIEKLLAQAERSVDVLATHAGPYGVWRGYYGDLHGSREVTRVIEQLQPRYCIGGHFHHAVGPLRFGRTTYLGLDGITSGRWQPYSGVSPGSVAILDTDREELTLVRAEWLGELAGPCAPAIALGGFGVLFDFVDWRRKETQT